METPHPFARFVMWSSHSNIYPRPPAPVAPQAVGRALAQVEALTSSLPPAAFQHRLRMLDQGVK